MKSSEFKLMGYELQTLYGIRMSRLVASLTHFALTNKLEVSR